MESIIAGSMGLSLDATAVRARRVEWTLRIAAAGCFIGHGAFGIITKSAWLPYFAVAGIGPELAYKLMPVIGTIDVLSAVIVLLSPRPFVLVYMVAWGIWTAALRPLAGESVFETIERAGNYGVPLALLLFMGRPSTLAGWFDRFTADSHRSSAATVGRVLLWTTAVLLFAHGGLAAITAKPLFAKQYAAIGLSASVVPIVGWIEMVVALLVLVAPSPALLIAIAAWKIATESLFPISGTPIWEFVERAGSYGAPLALALLSGTSPFTRITFHRTTR